MNRSIVVPDLAELLLTEAGGLAPITAISSRSDPRYHCGTPHDAGERSEGEGILDVGGQPARTPDAPLAHE